MELELRSAREEAQRQERNIQNISDTVNSKEAEVEREGWMDRQIKEGGIKEGKEEAETGRNKFRHE